MSDKFKIFLIDDDKVTLKMVEKLFRPYDVEVHSFSNPIEGLEAIDEYRPQLVFLDYMMPEMNGDEVIVKVSEAKLFNNCALYLLSATDFNDVQVIKFRTLGFYDVLHKPLNREVIEAVFNFHFGKIPLVA
jgi:DNA-binding response OmpR family regulator